MPDATKLMEEMFELVVRYKAEAPNPADADVHAIKAGGMVAAAGIMSQLRIPPEHAERMYHAAVDGMVAEAKAIKAVES